MTHIYKISGMTCTGCSAKVQGLLSAIKEVEQVSIDLIKGEATVQMRTRIPTKTLQEALKDHPKYILSELHQPVTVIAQEEKKSWLVTYKPILLIGAYILGITILPEAIHGSFYWQLWMNQFMAGFFITFSFFKLLDLNGFADSYAMYDIIAKRLRIWGYVYPFIELLLGIAYLVSFKPLITNSITIVVMTISIIGVLQSVLKKRVIRCACLGAIFNLPMSTITIIEDLLMIVMSVVMLTQMIL